MSEHDLTKVTKEARAALLAELDNEKKLPPERRRRIERAIKALEVLDGISADLDAGLGLDDET